MISNSRISLTIPSVLFLAFACYVILAAGMGGPIFASDEYAYFIAGKFNHQLAALYQLDPSLQRVSNFLYFSLIHRCSAWFGDHFLTAYRILHAAEYLAAVWLICHTIRPQLERQKMLFAVLSCLLFPAHVYIYAVMPEVDLMLLGAILGLLLVRVYPQFPLRASALLGAVLGAAILIKPHSVAMLLTALATLGLMWLTGVGPRRLAAMFGNAVLMLFMTYLVLIILLFASTGNWSLNPSAAMGWGLYGRYIESSAAHLSPLAKLASALYYLLGNLGAVALVFAPVLAWGGVHLLSRLRARHSDTPGQTALAIFSLVMLGAHLAMTAWFSAGAATLGDGEAMRLHGRYMGAALIWLPPLYFLALAEMSPRAKRLTSAALGAAVLLFMFVIEPKFKIYPWDNPLLMAFFNPQNWYRWAHEGAIPYLGMSLFIVLIVALFMAIWKRAWQSRILAVQLFLILAVGCVQNYAWLASHLRGTQEASRSGQALGLLLGDKQMGRGVLVTSERYGRASYLLFEMGNAPKVLELPPGALVSDQDVAGADWVVVDGNYQLQFDYKAALAMNQLRLMTLRTGPGALEIAPHAVPAALNVVKTLMAVGGVQRLNLAQAPGNGVLLSGFNPVEPWGAWSSEPKADVVVPQLLQGHLRITLFGWSLPQNLHAPLLLKVGDQAYPLQLGDKGQDLVLDVNVAKPADRISFESSVFRPADSARTLGVAIGRVSIERMKK